MQHGIMACSCTAPRLIPESPDSPVNFPNVRSDVFLASWVYVYITYAYVYYACDLQFICIYA